MIEPEMENGIGNDQTEMIPKPKRNMKETKRKKCNNTQVKIDKSEINDKDIGDKDAIINFGINTWLDRQDYSHKITSPDFPHHKTNLEDS